jgi:hypothetical protein
MKNIELVWSLTLSAALVWVAGCASPTAKPESQPSAQHQQPTTPPPAANAESQITLPPGATQPSAPFEGQGWQAMSDGQTLDGWRETPFTGINWTNEFPRVNYEIAFDAMRLVGSDFFCGLTVPVGTNCCSLIVGGWGGSLVGISSVDGMDASENETTKFSNFESGRWYRIRLRVTEKKIEAWIDQDKLVDLATADRRIAVRPGDIELSQPLGLAAWQTSAALREIKFRRVTAAAGKGD